MNESAEQHLEWAQREEGNFRAKEKSPFRNKSAFFFVLLVRSLSRQPLLSRLQHCQGWDGILSGTTAGFQALR